MKFVGGLMGRALILVVLTLYLLALPLLIALGQTKPPSALAVSAGASSS